MFFFSSTEINPIDNCVEEEVMNISVSTAGELRFTKLKNSNELI